MAVQPVTRPIIAMRHRTKEDRKLFLLALLLGLIISLLTGLALWIVNMQGRI